MLCRTSSLLQLLAAYVLLSAGSTAADGPADGGAYSVPNDAVRIATADLTAVDWKRAIYETVGRVLAGGASGPADEPDERTLPTALTRLTSILDRAEQRQRQLATQDARYISVNRAGFFRGLLVVWLPISFVLPTLARHPSYRSAPRSGLWKTRKLRRPAEEIETEPINAVTSSEYDVDADSYRFDVNYGPLLSRLDGYFSLLRVPDEDDCRPKVVCHVSRNTDQCQPLSQLFGSLFERSRQYRRPTFYHPALKKFFVHYWASEKGVRSTHTCDQLYPQCKRSFEQMIRKDMLHFWQGLSKRFAIQLEDE
jgi:hypothetical protein